MIDCMDNPIAMDFQSNQVCQKQYDSNGEETCQMAAHIIDFLEKVATKCSTPYLLHNCCKYLQSSASKWRMHGTLLT